MKRTEEALDSVPLDRDGLDTASADWKSRHCDSASSGIFGSGPSLGPIKRGARDIDAGLRAVSEVSTSTVKSSSESRVADLDGATLPAPNAAGPARSDSRDERYGRLYQELQRPARAMVRRAFGGMFSDAEIEDVYSSAWLGTLRALRNRPELPEPELRKYVLTAVANHASKELRRRGRRPTAPLEYAPEVADHQETPDERVATKERSQVTREILATLPERRRAVMMFRYGWGLDPQEVCGLVKGLSHRAYRKEISRGVDEISQKLRLVEQGRWCDDREPVLKAYAAGIADADQRRQAEQHLAHCRPCTDFVAKLNGHLHEIGSAVALTGTVGVGDGAASIVDRVGGALDRARQAAFDRAVPDSAEVSVGQVASSGAGRGAGAAGAGVLAKVAGAGVVPKLVAACVAGGAAATCVAAGVVPGIQLPGDDKPAAARILEQGAAESKPPAPPDTLPVQVGHDDPVPPSDGGGQADQPESEPADPAPQPEPAAEPQAPAPAQFDPVAAPPATSTPSGGGAAPASGSQGAQEFGP